MKNIIILLILILTISCKAQTVGLDTKYKDVSSGAYFKDLNNEMDKYVGTWQFTNGTDVLTIVLQKKLHVFDGEYYEDLLVGEYSYTSNGIEIVNTLPFLNDITNPNFEHSHIVGRTIINKFLFSKCNDCSPNERRFMLGFWDSERPYLTATEIILRYLPIELYENGTTSPIRMTATITATHGVSIPNENSPTATRIPYGEYLMFKQ